MKFAHMADCHVGSFRDPKLKELSAKAFQKAISNTIEEKVDFVLISGDLFNTSLPAMDSLRLVVSSLKKLKDACIPVYLICGSHDFSPSGRTIIDVITEAGLAQNVVRGSVHEKRLRLKFTTDEKTGAKITGMIGKRGQLERSYYESLDTAHLEQEEGYKIFMFHTALSELKPKGLYAMDASPLSLLPKGFNYYAGGHVHVVQEASFDGYKKIVYPGPLFPNSFREIEEIKTGGFYIVEDDKLSRVPISVVDFLNLSIEAKNKTPEIVNQEMLSSIQAKNLKNTLVTLRVEGELSSGRPSEIVFQDFFRKAYAQGAYFVMKNTLKLTAKGFEDIKVSHESSKELEERLISEHAGQQMITSDAESQSRLIRELISFMSVSREEGEKVSDFEKRLRDDVLKILKEA